MSLKFSTLPIHRRSGSVRHASSYSGNSESMAHVLSGVIWDDCVGGCGGNVVSGGFATVHPNNKLTINAVEAAPLEDFSSEVRHSFTLFPFPFARRLLAATIALCTLELVSLISVPPLPSHKLSPSSSHPIASHHPTQTGNPCQPRRSPESSLR